MKSSYKRSFPGIFRRSQIVVWEQESWPENQKMHHRTSTDSIYQSMCDICFVHLGQKITRCIIAHRPIRFLGDVRYLFLYILARKSKDASSHIDRFDSWVLCDVCFLHLGQKITRCIIAHRPIRFTSRCAISVLYSIYQSMCDICFCTSWPENHEMHHRTSTDSILGRCAISCFVHKDALNTTIGLLCYIDA